ncbi:MAG TPA: zinc-binding protein [Lentisphaeria bacterium]|nr:MAG: hypothetical protein A2X45_00090 [Lentisphaerae bacterium GWF2_50_93]HCE46687.1 zinc-binding protein [Lentisphaeria bacterium]
MIYSEIVGKLLSLGEPKSPGPEWIDYSQIGLVNEHIPELIAMVCDDGLNFASTDADEVWAPLHAWRALAQMKAVQTVDALLAQLHLVEDNDDDWMSSDFPLVFSKMGHPAIQPLSVYIADPGKPLFARICAAECVRKIGEADLLARNRCIEVLAGSLRNHDDQNPSLNAFLILYLTDLDAVESINEIRQAYLSNKVDMTVLGDLEDAEISLGHRCERLTPRRKGFLPLDFEMPPDALEPGHDLPFVNHNRKPGGNDPCPCGSRKKYKKCCLK